MSDDLPTPLVSAAWLKANVGAPDLRIVDASWYLPGTPRDPDAEFLERHVPGAVRFDLDQVSDRSTPLPHMLPSPQAFAEAVGTLGIDDGDRVVIYAADGIVPAARVWWSFRVMGHDAVAVLDGGLPAWLAADGPLEAGAAPPRQPARFTARFRPELVKRFDQVLDALSDDALQVVDVRPALRFRGEAPEPRPGLKAGHMPGAKNAPYGELIGPDSALQPPQVLAQAVARGGVDTSRPVIASCGSGVSACVLALALARLGRWDAAVYDGSWAEWGGRADAPVVQGAA